MRIAVLLCLCAISASASASAEGAQPRLSQVFVYIHVHDRATAHRGHKNYEIEMLPPCPRGAEGCLMDPSEVRRGMIATFAILNLGKRLHRFTVFGKTRVIEPGAHASFFVRLVTRGSFPFLIDHGTTEALRGVFVVN